MATIFGGKGCVDPLELYNWCLTADPPIPTEAWWGRANGFELNPIGREPGRGWILLAAADLTAIGQTTDQSLKFSGTDTSHAYTLQKITLLSAQCVTPGADSDMAAVYLCQLADRRYHLARIPLDKAYNVRTADGTDYLTQTKNSGSAWTWAQIVSDLASTLSITVGSLPFTPDATPENLSYWCSFAWDALNDVLDRMACGLKYDPEGDTFSIVRLGVSDGSSSIQQANNSENRTWDSSPIDPVRAWRPEKVRVQFLRRPRPTDGSSPYYAVDVTLTATTGVVSGSYVQLEDDLSALGATGTPSNSAALSTRATERAGDWLRKRSGYERPLLKVYADFIPDVVRKCPGSILGGVSLDDRGGPMRTQLVAKQDRGLERWEPLAKLPPWFPPDAAASSSAATPWVHYRATANITISSPGSSSANFDGQTPSVNDRILLPQQATGSQNGPYVYNGAAVPMTRCTDFSTAAQLTGAEVYVIKGSTWAGTYWTCTTPPTITVDATPLTWAQTPMASRTIAGLVSTTTQSFKGTKTFAATASGASGGLVVTPGSATASFSLSSDITNPSANAWTFDTNSAGNPFIQVVVGGYSGGGVTLSYVSTQAVWTFTDVLAASAMNPFALNVGAGGITVSDGFSTYTGIVSKYTPIGHFNNGVLTSSDWDTSGLDLTYIPLYASSSSLANNRLALVTVGGNAHLCYRDPYGTFWDLVGPNTVNTGTPTDMNGFVTGNGSTLSATTVINCGGAA